MRTAMGKDNRAWHSATQRSPQELAKALAALAADVGEPSPRHRSRRNRGRPVRDPWVGSAPEWPEPELEAESIPEARDLRRPFPLPEEEPEAMHEMHPSAASENLVEPASEEPESEQEHFRPAPQEFDTDRGVFPPEPEAFPPEPEAFQPEREAFQPDPDVFQPDPEPPRGRLIAGRSLTGGERPPLPPAEPTFHEQWDDAPLPDAGTPITARAAWTAQGVRSRAAGGRMRPPAAPRLKSGRGVHRPGPQSRKRLILLVAGVLVVLLLVIIALGGGGSSKTSSTGSVRQSVASTPTTVVIPPPAASATTPNSRAPASHISARLRARCKVANFRKHHPHKCHAA